MLKRSGFNSVRPLVSAAAALMALLSGPAASADPPPREALLDRLQIEDMMVEYYTILPQRDHHDLGEYFSSNAELVLNGDSYKGRDAIQKFYDGALDPRIQPGKSYNMLIGNPRIKVTGNTATMDAIWTGILSDHVKAPPRLIEQGTEHTDFIKQDGRWLVTRRVIVSESGLP